MHPSIRQLKSGLEHGSRLSDYEITSLLGKGAFSNVFHGVSKHTGHDVAIKVVDKKAAKANNTIHRIISEIELHSRLEHFNIVDLYSYSEDKSSFYIIMEYCNQGDLFTYLHEHGSLPEETVRQFGKQIVSSLSYLHSHNIVHRDLKLSNILLKTDTNATSPSLKLADFGLAVYLEDNNSEANTICGTLNYIAPEVFARKPYGKPSDRWSLGCLLFALVSGYLPFDGQEPPKTNVRLVFPSHVSSNAKDLITKLLKVSPNERLDLACIQLHPFFNDHNDHESCRSTPTTYYRPASRLSNLTSMSPLTTPTIKQKRFKVKQHLTPLSTHNVRTFTHTAKLGKAVIEGPGKAVKLVFDADGSVFSVSGDGREITVTKPSTSGDMVSTVYELAELPSKYHKKYLYAANFVQIVAQKTAVVEYRTDSAVFTLTAADTFIGKFQEGIELEIQRDKLKVLQANGDLNTSYQISSDFSSICSPSPPQSLSFAISHMLESFQLCANLARSAHEDLPISVIHPSAMSKEDTKPEKSNTPEDNTSSVTSVVNITSAVDNCSLNSPVFDPNIGWGFRIGNGTVMFALSNGTLLSLSRSGQVVSVLKGALEGRTFNLLSDSIPQSVMSHISLVAPLLAKMNSK
ncbi:hypothetical protein P9112_004303 [Eukaryota sp. TZLM1-RC]